MLTRIIPRMDIKGPNLVKGVHLEGLRIMGDPAEFATRYCRDGADELIYIDQVASLYGRNNLENIIIETSENLFTPLTVGGGIRTVQDIHRLLRAGADKVTMNTNAILRPSLIKEAAKVFGSQCIVLYIEAKQRGKEQYECLTNNARERTGKDVFEWVKEAVDLGVGEILVTSVDRDGTGKGFDINLMAHISHQVNVPVIASGGAGTILHIKDVINNGGVAAVCLASMVHYRFLSRTRNKITPMTVSEIKSNLTDMGVGVR